MAKQLNIRSDEAYETAHALAGRCNESVTAVVERALRELKDRVVQEEAVFSPDAIARRYLELREITARTAANKRPGATSDHSDLYDEGGLPK
jgi:antitoxin VapB